MRGVWSLPLLFISDPPEAAVSTGSHVRSNEAAPKVGFVDGVGINTRSRKSGDIRLGVWVEACALQVSSFSASGFHDWYFLPKLFCSITSCSTGHDKHRESPSSVGNSGSALLHQLTKHQRPNCRRDVEQQSATATTAHERIASQVSPLRHALVIETLTKAPYRISSQE